MCVEITVCLNAAWGSPRPSARRPRQVRRRCPPEASPLDHELGIPSAVLTPALICSRPWSRVTPVDRCPFLRQASDTSHGPDPVVQRSEPERRVSREGTHARVDRRTENRRHCRDRHPTRRRGPPRKAPAGSGAPQLFGKLIEASRTIHSIPGWGGVRCPRSCCDRSPSYEQRWISGQCCGAHADGATRAR
jgi:hypothetical protein